MRLLFIRHGDPDYERDKLTEKGRREASLLSERIAPMSVKDYYVSPLGRARETAGYTLAKAGRSAKECDWLREFDIPVKDAQTGGTRLAWDQLPEVWTEERRYFDKDEWADVPLFAEADIRSAAKRVTDGLDGILAQHGYERSGAFYTAKQPNKDTLVFFCHFGVTCVMLSHLLNVSPMILWHGCITLTSSVTELFTEERREGKAYFRMDRMGDVSHLYAAGTEPSFSGRFCEIFTDTEQRHD